MVGDLLKVDIGVLLRALRRQDPQRLKFGLIPQIASCYVGHLMAESFSERTYRCAKEVLTEGNSLLSHEEIDMVVVLRMNRRFMEHMRKEYSSLSKQGFNITLDFGDDN